MSVAIQAVGLATPWGNNLTDFARNFSARKNALVNRESVGDRFSTQNIPASGFGLIQNFDPKLYLDAKILRKYDTFSRYACAVAALCQQSLKSEMNFADMAIAYACESQVTTTATYLDTLFKEGPEFVSARLFPMASANSTSGHVSMELGIQGPNLNLSAKYASGFMTIYSGLNLLRAGHASSCLVGSADYLSQIFLECYGLMGALKNKPGDASGFIPGEAVVSLILEKNDTATYGKIIRAASLTSAANNYRWPHDSQAHALTLKKAVGADKVDFYFPAGNGDHRVQALEEAAMKLVFPDNARPEIVDIKQYIGESPTSALVQVVAACLLPQGSHSLISVVSPGGVHGAILVESVGWKADS